ncbi:MAG: TolC family protein [Calditrichae bacterium]|nr:TolC family protein [Calditrichia bacterium]
MFSKNRSICLHFILIEFFFLVFSCFGNVPDETPGLINMETAINRALSLNNQVKASDYALKQAAWDKRRAWTMLFPVLTFNSRYTWIDDSTFALRDFSRYFQDPNLPFTIPQTVFQESYVSSFDLSMPIFNGNLINGLSIASTNEDLFSKQNIYTRDNIIFQVIKSYLSVLKSQEVLRLQNEYLNLSQLNYEKALRLFEAGRWSKSDALRWQIELQKQKSSVISSETNLSNTIAVLNRLLNFNVHQELNIEKRIPVHLEMQANEIQQKNKNELFNEILLSDDELVTVNAALNAVMLGEKMSRLQYKNAYSGFMPRISLDYSYSWRENNTIALDDYSPQTLMINFSLPLFSSFQDYTAVKSSYYAYKKNQEEYYDQIKNTRLILTETVNKILNIKTQMELSKLNVEFNQLNYNTIETQREKGLASNIDFVDAKVNLQNALLEDVSNRYDFTSAVVELYYLLGKIHKLVE